jgi:hypothetical protein
VNLALATLVAGVIGYASIAFLLRYLKTHSTYLFIIYRLALTAMLLALLWQGVLSPYPAEREARSNPPAETLELSASQSSLF